MVYVFGESYINADTTVDHGINRAVELGLVPSRLADIIYSSLPHPASALFLDSSNRAPASFSHPRGRLFALFRHPADRAAASFHYLSTSQDRPVNFPNTILDYAVSSFVENNLMTRLLTDKPKGNLTEADLVMAQEVLRRKCLVGLYDRLADSLARFESYFGLPSGTGSCRAGVLEDEQNRRNSFPSLEEGSYTYNLIMTHNHFDVDIYIYAKQLYNIQVVADGESR